jgi:hypothetical protein
MKGFSLAFFVFMLLVWGQQCVAQPEEQSRWNIGVEIGGGLNSLFWSSPFNIRTPGGVSVDRTHLWITPNVRINSYFSPLDWIKLVPFIGYDRVGGSSGEDTYSLDVAEIGCFALYQISGLHIGPGIKWSYLLRATYDTNPSSLGHVDRSTWFAKGLLDAGLRVSHPISDFTIAVEFWQGLNGLGIGPLDGATIRGNHYRFLVGYTFSL